MAQENTLLIAKKFASEVHKSFETSRVYLFGSQAKGLSHEDSDIDIAVVISDYPNKIEIMMQLMRIRRKIDSRIEPHPFRENEFNISNKLVEEILKYGFELIN